MISVNLTVSVHLPKDNFAWRWDNKDEETREDAGTVWGIEKDCFFYWLL